MISNGTKCPRDVLTWHITLQGYIIKPLYSYYNDNNNDGKENNENNNNILSVVTSAETMTPSSFTPTSIDISNTSVNI